MIGNKNIRRHAASASTIITVLLMCVCLLLVTGANFFVQDGNNSSVKRISMNADSDDNEAHNPAEEQSKSNQSPAVQEEYLQEKYSFKNLTSLTIMLHHSILEAEKLQIVHYKLIAPPPKLS